MCKTLSVTAVCTSRVGCIAGCMCVPECRQIFTLKSKSHAVGFVRCNTQVAGCMSARIWNLIMLCAFMHYSCDDCMNPIGPLQGHMLTILTVMLDCLLVFMIKSNRLKPYCSCTCYTSTQVCSLIQKPHRAD